MKIDLFQIVRVHLLTLREGVYERKRKCRQRRVKASAVGLAFALGIQRIINNKFAFENLAVGEPERSEATGNPT